MATSHLDSHPSSVVELGFCMPILSILVLVKQEVADKITKPSHSRGGWLSLGPGKRAASSSSLTLVPLLL